MSVKLAFVNTVNKRVLIHRRKYWVHTMNGGILRSESSLATVLLQWTYGSCVSSLWMDRSTTATLCPLCTNTPNTCQQHTRTTSIPGTSYSMSPMGPWGPGAPKQLACIFYRGIRNKMVNGPEFQYVQGSQLFCNVTAKEAGDMNPYSKQVVIMCVLSSWKCTSNFPAHWGSLRRSQDHILGCRGGHPLPIPLKLLWHLERKPHRPGGHPRR